MTACVVPLSATPSPFTFRRLYLTYVAFLMLVLWREWWYVFCVLRYLQAGAAIGTAVGWDRMDGPTPWQLMLVITYHLLPPRSRRLPISPPSFAAVPSTTAPSADDSSIAFLGVAAPAAACAARLGRLPRLLLPCCINPAAAWPSCRRYCAPSQCCERA